MTGDTVTWIDEALSHAEAAGYKPTDAFRQCNRVTDNRLTANGLMIRDEVFYDIEDSPNTLHVAFRVSDPTSTKDRCTLSVGDSVLIGRYHLGEHLTVGTYLATEGRSYIHGTSDHYLMTLKLQEIAKGKGTTNHACSNN